MTNQQREAIRKILKEQTEQHAANPASARAFLLRTGIYTSDGSLAPEYGGPATLALRQGEPK